MKRIVTVVALVATSLISGSCSSTRFWVDYDTRHDFSGYSSYAWFKLATPPEEASPPTRGNTILTRRIRWAVDSQLADRGFEKVDFSQADFLVTYSLVLQPQVVMVHTGWTVPIGGWGWGGWGWGMGWSGGRSSVQSYTEGTIIVDVLDPKTRVLVWRGIVERAFKRPNPDDEQIKRVVMRVMRDFPPR